MGGMKRMTDQEKNDYFRQERREVEAVVPDHAERILDVGCGEGILGRNLLNKGAKEVTGIELSREVCDRAKDNLTNVICGDIENIDLNFKKKYFDCMIFADILEHLKDPLSILKKCSEYLSDSGCVVTSIPNVGYYGVIDMLAQGQWTYAEHGILDRTHVRFFTRKEIETLFSNAGFEITSISYNMNSAYENLDDPYSGNISFGRVELSGLSPEEMRDLFVFQYIIRAQKIGCDKNQVKKDIEEATGSNNFEGALKILEDYLKLHSADTDMLYTYAGICFKLGHFNEAEESLRKILIFQPQREDALHLMRNIKNKKKEYQNDERSIQENNINFKNRMDDQDVKKIAIVRGANLNKWEMQNYEPLQESFELTAYTTNQTNFDISKLSIPVVQLPFKHQGLLMEMQGLEAGLADKDLVFSADITYKFSAQAVSAKQRYGYKVVCLEWENIPYNYEEYEEVHQIKETVRTGADHFIAVTERAKEALMIEGVAEGKIDVIPMGVDLNVFRPVQDGLDAERRKLGITRDERIVLFIGRMVWEKGIYDFLHAAARMCRDSILSEKQIRFLTVGKGPELEGARERAGALGISSSTIFIEEYPYKDMYKLYNIANLFVLPSISTRSWQEQFGMVLIESMACGTPVISTYSGSIPEVVGDGGMLVQPNDHLSLYMAMKEMISNDDHRTDLGKMALKRAETMFDAEKIADKVKDVFHKVMSRKTEADLIQEAHVKSIKYWEQGDREKAFNIVCEAFGKDPDNNNILDSVISMGMKLEQFDTVEKSINEFLVCHPANLDALNSLSEVLVRMGRAHEAEQELKKVLIFDSENIRALSILGELKAVNSGMKT
jgi:glycosyltransferase involved in cell wall biosynthesis/2-polyprenyl-3-methyl-5-hydroxy-6-metoxy-1,4-benzoquinol methylase